MVATLMMGVTLLAQENTTIKSEVIKDFKAGGFLGSDVENYYLWKTNEGGVTSLCVMDKELNLGNKHDLYNGDFAPDHTFINDKQLLMVSTLSSETQVVIANKNRRKIDTLLVEHAKGYWKGKEVRYALEGLSANKQRFCVASFAEDELGEKQVAKVRVMDNEMSELWKYDGENLPSKSMIVTDFGEVVLGGFVDIDEESQKINLSVLSGQAQRNFEMTLPEIVLRDIEVLNYQNGKILCSGVIRTPGHKVQNHKSMVGICTWTYDVNANVMSEVNRIDFTDQDLDMLYNGKASAKTFRQGAPKMECHKILTPDGGVLLNYGLAYREVELTKEGKEIVTYNNVGDLVWRLDAQGKVLWHNGFYKALNSLKGYEALCEPMVMRENDVYYLLPNSKKNKIDKEGKVRMVTVDEADGAAITNLMLVHIDAYGRVDKQIVYEDKHINFGSSFWAEGRNLMTLISDEKGHANVIKVKLPK